MIWPLLAYMAMGCAGMLVIDSMSVLYQRYVASDRGWMAGYTDAAKDAATMFVFSIATVRLTAPRFGIWGWLALLPTLLTAVIVTHHAVRLSDGIDETPEDERERKRQEFLEKIGVDDD